MSETKKVLIVCDMGLVRSVHTANYLREYSKKQNLPLEIAYGGISHFALMKINRRNYETANLVLVMEPRIEKWIVANYGNGIIIRDLGIINAYLPNGDFNKFFFRQSMVNRERKEIEMIKERPEISEKWDLQKLIASKDWEKILSQN